MEPQKRKKNGRRRWLVALAWLAVLVIVPLGFILSGRFTQALQSMGVRLHPNLDGGERLAEGAAVASQPVEEALGQGHASLDDLGNLRTFTVHEVVFRRFSGVGIAERLNLSFEFAGKLTDPHQSPLHFSNIVIHIFIGNGEAGNGRGSENPPLLPQVAFQEGDWQYQVIVDGFHDRPRIFDRNGRLIALGLGVYLRPENGDGKSEGKNVSTRLTAALPRSLFKKLLEKPVFIYFVAGVPDLGNPFMLCLNESGGLTDFATFKPEGKRAVEIDGSGRPILPPLIFHPR